MKRIILVFNLLVSLFATAIAQNEDYIKTMEEVVTAIQTAKRDADLTPFANQLERIAAVETKEWLPNYWAAYCYMTKSYGEQSGDKKDILLEKAEIFIAAADKLNPANDEIEVIKASIASARMSVDPQNRWQKYKTIMIKAFGAAKKLNPENPRLKLLEAQSIFFSPEEYGGGKKKALPLFEDAAAKFEKFKPSSNLMPDWGAGTATYFIAEARK